ncbi:MAG: STAS domain-containing protein [Bacteroidales bacterium]|nr:STAS domain-containing protein [Bacteroidales bacterium]
MLKIERENNRFIVSFFEINRLNTTISKIIEKQLVQLLNENGAELLLDLKGIKFIDTSGFNTLHKLHEISNKYNSRLFLTNVSLEVKELFRLLELEDAFSECMYPGKVAEVVK